MLERKSVDTRISSALKRSRIVGLIGPRQCGKTTLARRLVDVGSPNYFDLEDPTSLARLEAPKLALEPLTGLVVIDEIQRRPELFPYLRVLADRANEPATFLLLGSASPELLRQSSESLAGRIEYLELSPLSILELEQGKQRDSHLIRGGYPRSLLAKNDLDSWKWRKGFIQTFLERDIPQLGIKTPSTTIRRFWTMLAHYHGQIFNASEIARSMGVNQTTASHYLDVLSAVFMIRVLPPWHENLKKRQVKRPKIYFRDTGIFHSLLGVKNQLDLEVHPKLGAAWEGYAIEEVIRACQPDESYFWATHNGAELDLLLLKDGRKIGLEFKRSDAPALTPSMKIAMEDLGLERIDVIYPGTIEYLLADKIYAVPLESWLSQSL
ncbi:MAG: ATP-binding protein [Verrucomicrobiota bacterium]